ncbi:glycosyltransferase family 25 protein [Vibrio parahaemolyticus]|uniref:Lgt2 n=1 Tax=Vibrio parahaemolyticus TaxID=670 RepID=A0A5Q5AWW3_VIBPH|nr:MULTISPECIES: glycosyltransferase family 25 protein [Vibrio harveyi group]EGR1172475.1 glycosyltransferase family 25 protein [Vibrio parahaemolyticus]EJG0223788.1 glycosyltransferase family 25 protein [Vibrio parahaemolyticus]EJG0347816.1 glycosyltransferase family 25 protein [Vibrio parahaemolyticus]EJG0552753.1 glycosyltransferase family 25 protein [Vibrio parahaemolyticus]EJG1727454.1 glycosyltransferase family 25 protein [Vibrio parahaemolyticus]
MKIQHRVISLSTATKRRQDIKREFEREGLTFSFFDAVRGSELNLTEFRALDTPYERELSAGEVGCYLSHISVLREFIDSDYDFLAVYEDDICLKNNYAHRVNNILSGLDEKCFDILLVGYRNEYLSFWGSNRFNGVLLKRFCDYGWGAHSYVVTKTSAQKILSHFSFPLLPYDCITGGYTKKYANWKNVLLKIYATPNKLVELHEVNSESSTIEDREDLRSNAKGRLLKPIVNIVKALKPLSRYHYE